MIGFSLTRITVRTTPALTAAGVAHGCTNDLLVFFGGEVLRGIDLAGLLLQDGNEGAQVIVGTLQEVLIHQADIGFVGLEQLFLQVADVDLFDGSADLERFSQRLAAAGDKLGVKTLQFRDAELTGGKRRGRIADLVGSQQSDHFIGMGGFALRNIAEDIHIPFFSHGDINIVG